MPQSARARREAEHVEEDDVVVRVVRDEVEIEDESRAGAAGTAGAAFEMPREERVVERAAVWYRRPSEPRSNGATTLELVQRDVDAGVVQPRERAFDAVIANQPLAGVVRDPGLPQQRRVRACGVLEDRTFQQLEKHARAIAQRRFQNGAALCGVGRRLPEKTRQPSDHPRAHHAFIEE